jgi:hypothetical protein
MNEDFGPKFLDLTQTEIALVYKALFTEIETRNEKRPKIEISK